MEREAHEIHSTRREFSHYLLHSGIGKALVVFALFLTSLAAAATAAAAAAAAVVDWFFLFVLDHTNVFVTSGQEDEDDHIEAHQASKQEEFVGLDRQKGYSLS
jgi:ABC-type sugar transport system substrate-binding protein